VRVSRSPAVNPFAPITQALTVSEQVASTGFQSVDGVRMRGNGRSAAW
jgi:hypothetical protein